MNQRILTKLSSITAICLLMMITVLCIQTFIDAPAWVKIFENALFMLLGYYIGRNRTNEEQPK